MTSAETANHLVHSQLILRINKWEGWRAVIKERCGDENGKEKGWIKINDRKKNSREPVVCDRKKHFFFGFSEESRAV
jgi:hypothetical protein